MEGERLIIFTRFPEAGKVKSRLEATLGTKRALEIHDELARRTVTEARAWGGEVELRITGGSEPEWKGWLGDGRWIEQGAGGLGERLARSVESAFADGVQRVVVIGTDCPALDRECIGEAFRRLRGREVVFGPARDGGYYLLGLAGPRPELFEGIDWGTDRVLRQSVEKAGDADLMPVLTDVDVEADLEACRRDCGWSPAAGTPTLEP